MGKILTLAKHFELYLERVSLDKVRITLAQYTEIRRAWYGGVGQTLIMSRDDLPELEEDKAILQLEKWHDECGEFWNNEMKVNGTD